MAFNPAIHTATNKPIGLIGKPVDARTYFYDAVNFVYRAYVDTAEVLAYLNTAPDRVGQFSIIINTGGSLASGVITGGTNLEWWFKDGVLDADLVIKGNGGASVIPTTITANVTATPLVVNYDVGIYPAAKPMLVKTADNKIDNNTNISWVPGMFTVYGDDFGDGTWAESYVFYVMP